MTQSRPTSRPPLPPGMQRAVAGLASIFGLRMLGLFMILPVFSLYADGLAGYSPILLGFAIGAYGLTQALLQIPFGMLSDRIGRKPVIAGGLLVFALGSVVAALSDHIAGVIVGRALQGAGAIAAAVMALTADLTPDEHRTKAMAVIGMSIGLAFFASLIAGPVLGHWVGLAGIFWLTAALALGGLVVLYTIVPAPRESRVHRDAEPVPAQFSRVLRDPQLLRLDLGILLLHLMMTSTFVALPLALRDYAGVTPGSHWQVYLAVLLASVAVMVPFVVLAERRRQMKAVFVGAVAALGLAQLGMAGWHDGLWPLAALLVLYFAAFNILEASLPSLVSRIAPSEGKGTAMGVYSSSQFLGAFAGGLLGGHLLWAWGLTGVFLLNAGVALVWLAAAATMERPSSLSSRLVPLGPLGKRRADELAARLSGVPGVAEAVVVADEEVAYLKVDRARLDEQALARAAAHG